MIGFPGEFAKYMEVSFSAIEWFFSLPIEKLKASSIKSFIFWKPYKHVYTHSLNERQTDVMEREGREREGGGKERNRENYWRKEWDGDWVRDREGERGRERERVKKERKEKKETEREIGREREKERVKTRKEGKERDRVGDGEKETERVKKRKGR